ncbi:MAG: carbohydrate binding domain-containing protein, partial [Clostridia bacterium]|nr:carbohydrate binding domain-containing protein [Clostridia bacterium]
IKMKKAFIFIALVALMFTVMSICVHAEQITLTTCSDAYIAEKTPNSAMGSSDKNNLLSAMNKGSSAALSRRDVVWKFDLTGIDTSSITEAKLYVNVKATTNPGIRVASIYKCLEAQWDENTVTWNTAPDISGEKIGEISIPLNSLKQYSIDVTNAVRNYEGDSLTLRLVLDTATATFSSKEENDGKAACLVLSDAPKVFVDSVSVTNKNGDNIQTIGFESGEDVVTRVKLSGVGSNQKILAITSFFNEEQLLVCKSEPADAQNGIADIEIDFTIPRTEDAGRCTLRTFLWDGVSLLPVGKSINARGVDRASVEDWSLVWSDEFENDGIDAEKWNVIDQGGGFGNEEEQYYRPENATVEDGVLKITAKKENYNGHKYTSAKLTTMHKADFTYGRFEARIKLPEGQGLWPAFWMMPTDSEYGTWAASGELDIMEARGRFPQVVGGALHYGGKWPENVYSNKDYIFPDETSIGDYHTYSMEWEPGEVRWYVDNELYFTHNEWSTTGEYGEEAYVYPAPFDKDFYIILNLAIGGTFDNYLVPSDEMLPAVMEVDYVRVYELTGRDYRVPENPDGEKEYDFSVIKTPLEMTGNHIYNGAFDKYAYNGLTYWYTEGEAEVDLTERILVAGNNSKIYQTGVMAKAGEKYKLSFKLSDGEALVALRSGRTLLLNENAVNGENTFEFVSPVTANDCVLEFIFPNGGKIDNVALVQTSIDYDKVKAFPLVNGSFELGSAGWSVFTEGTSASLSVAGNCAEMQVNSLGSEPWKVMLMQKGVKLSKAIDYRFSFDAWSDVERDMEFSIENSSYYRYCEAAGIRLSDTAKNFEYTFKMTADDTVDVKFLLGLTNDGKVGKVYIDNVRLEVIQSDFKKPAELICEAEYARLGENVCLRYTAEEGWKENVKTVIVDGEETDKFSFDDDYLVIDKSVFKNGGIFRLVVTAESFADAEYDISLYNQNNIALNGDFSDGLDGWGYWNEAADWSFAEEKDGTAHVQINYHGEKNNEWSVPYSWSTQFYNRGIKLKKGKTYTVSFNAWSDVDRPIQLELTNYSQNKTTFHITEDHTKTYTMSVTPDKDAEIDLNFLLGYIEDSGKKTPNGVHHVYIDNLMVVEK